MNKDNKEHIILLSDNLDSGGAQRQLIGLSIMLQERGYKVEIIDYFQIKFWDSYLIENNIRFTHLRCNENSSLSKMMVVWKYLYVNNPTHVIAFLNSPTIIAGLFKMFFPHRFTLISSDRNTDINISRYTKLKFFAYRFAEWIVPNSHTQAEVIMRNCPKLSKKIKVITNFVDQSKFAPTPTDKLLDNHSKILAVGRFAPQKDVLSLLRALVLLDEERLAFHIDWYGRPNPQSYFDECLKFMEDHPGIKKYISFHNHINNIETIYANYGALILTSIYEGYPNVIGEAMSCGLPILCTNVCDNGYMVKDGVNGFLFEKEVPRAIADAIIRYIKMSDDQILEMYKNNIAFAQETLSMNTFVNNYIEMI